MRNRITYRTTLPFATSLICLVPAAAFGETDTPDAFETLEALVVNADDGEDRKKALPLDNVNATGSRLGLTTRELPASVSVVTQDFIQLRGARTAVEAVENAVGMSGGTSVGSIPNFSTRGFAGNDITIMRDGIRQNTNSQSARPLDAFLFDRIEVLKGPASILYGEGAIGGAVNYVSKLPGENPEAEALLSAGSFDTYRTAFGAGGPVGGEDSPVGFRFDASRQTTDGYVDSNESELNALAAALVWQISPIATLTAQGTYLKDSTDSYYGTPVVYDGVINQNGVTEIRKVRTATDRLINPRIDSRTRRTNYNIQDNFARATNGFGRLILDVKPTENFSPRNEAYFATQDLEWRNAESYTFNPVTGLVDRNNFFLIYRDDLVLGNRLDLTFDHELFGRENRFVLGGLVERADQIRNSGQPGVISTLPSVTLVNPDVGVGQNIGFQKTAEIIVDTAALYLEDVYSVSEDVKLVGGLRVERIHTRRNSLIGQPDFEKSFHPITGRLGAIWEVNEQVNIYGSYSSAAQPVSQLVSLNTAQDNFGLQTGRQFEIGAKSSFWDEKMNATLAIYDIEKNDLLTTTLVNGVQTPQQVGAQVSQGAEFAVSVEPVPEWRVEGNISYAWLSEFQDFQENLGTTATISRDRNRPPNVPETVANLFLMHTRGPWQFRGGARYVGERFANNNNGITMAAYTTLDAAISYTHGPATYTLRGRNLTDRTYSDWAVNGGAMQHLGDPRSAEFGVNIQF